MHTFTDAIDIWNSVKAGTYTGTAAGNVTFGSAVSMAGYDAALILLSGSAAAAAGSVTLAAYSATSAANAGSATISGATLTFVGTAAAADVNQLHAITVKADQLPAGALLHGLGRPVPVGDQVSGAPLGRFVVLAAGPLDDADDVLAGASEVAGDGDALAIEGAADLHDFQDDGG